MQGYILLTASLFFFFLLGTCIMTRAAMLLNRFFYKVWFFGACYYWGTWLFLAVSTSHTTEDVTNRRYQVTILWHWVVIYECRIISSTNIILWELFVFIIVLLLPDGHQVDDLFLEKINKNFFIEHIWESLSKCF